MWLPPLVYTSLNEAGATQYISIPTLCVFYLGSIIALQVMSAYKQVSLVIDEEEAIVEEKEEEEVVDLESTTSQEKSQESTTCISLQTN